MLLLYLAQTYFMIRIICHTLLPRSTPWMFVDAESCVVAIRHIVSTSHADPDHRRSIIVSTKLQAGSASAATAAPGTVLHSLLAQQRPLSTSRASRLSHHYYYRLTTVGRGERASSSVFRRFRKK